MNDPHVVALQYRVLETNSFKFKDPPDVSIDTPEFRGRLSKNILTLEPKEHFESEERIRPLADKFIQSWEISAGLKYDRPDFNFRFEGSQIVDRNPTPGTAEVHSAEHLYFSDTVRVEKFNTVYPDPPKEFRITPEVELFWNRYCRYVEDKEPLLGMAYSCLTYLERDKVRSAAAQHYGIELDVLNMLGKLTSTRGDNSTARKFSSDTTPLSSDEETWIKSAIVKIINHLATIKPGQILKMTDLPPLN